MRIVGCASALALCLFFVGCQDAKKAEVNKYDTGLKELKIEDVEVGTGEVAEKGDYVYMLYRGTFIKDGKQFDSNMDDVTSRFPFGFNIGTGAVIQGWHDGIEGMREGGTRILDVPSRLAYGARGRDGIPANSDLRFEVKLLFLSKPGEEGRFDFNDDVVGTGPEAKANDTVTIHYVGTYLTGKQWDNSKERGKAETFPLKVTEESMPGLIYGIEGMKVGGKRTLVLSPSMAFGISGTQSVQGNQPLKIVVELLAVNGKGA